MDREHLEFVEDFARKVYETDELIVRTYDGECARGIVHTKEWDEKIKQVRAGLPNLARLWQEARERLK